MNARMKPLRGKKRPQRSKPTRAHWGLLVLAAVLVIATVVWAGRAFVLSEQMRVTRVLVDGVQRLDPALITQVAQRVKGEPILLLDLDTLRADLEALPGVEGIVAARRMPDIVEIHVSERTAIARARLDGVNVLIDSHGVLFHVTEPWPSDEDLPRLLGLSTQPGDAMLVASDIAALRALEALERITGERPPVGTVIDLTPEDRIVMRPGPDAPVLWLDRDHPEQNLENLYARGHRVVALASGSPIDLRFPGRLAVVTQGTARR